MIDPSGIRLPKGEEFRIEEVKHGLFIVENAYEGEYEYFDGRPMFTIKENLEPIGSTPDFDCPSVSVVPSSVPASKAYDLDGEPD